MERLKSLNDWYGKAGTFSAPRSAQSCMSGAQTSRAAAGTACGVPSDPGKEGEKRPAPKPSACGVPTDPDKGGDKKPAPKPSACGAGAGAW